MASIVYENIANALQQIDSYRGSAMAVESPSRVSATNPHRGLLESVRIDLLHYDEEKHNRIVFNIKQYLSQCPDEDPELVEVLQRVLEIVNRFQEKNEVLFTPEKPIQVSRILANPELKAKSRQLFNFLNQDS